MSYKLLQGLIQKPSSLMKPEPNLQSRAQVTICGVVQGVGFRPWVYRLATEMGLAGWVSNTAQGVRIEVEGGRTELEQFLVRLEPEKPPHSFIQSIETLWLPPLGYEGFAIRESDSNGAKTAFVPPDIATCPECLSEILTPGNRRFGYPFTNCTHCGPRFSIIAELPYDRPNTSMKGFTMCEKCRREYDDPADRRFHAQPNACPDCGPHLEWWNAAGQVLASRDAALDQAVGAISEGAIVAVKGLGGFHLIVDARNEQAVQRLRRLKNREEKPFAVMVPSTEKARVECEISEMQERLLRSPEAPIVLLRRKGEGSSLAASIAPGNPFLGMLLPYTPLHHLLLARIGSPIVATSGNRSEEPICTDELEALERLGGIADFFLVHNRPILRYVDDSVARVVLGREMILRRARGYAPLPVQLHCKKPGEAALAVGAHLKNTIALSIGDSVFTSQHLGDLETAPALEAHQSAIADFQRLYQARPSIIACDAHPDYLSTKIAEKLAKQTGARLLPVQHHFAHILSCMAENQAAPSALGVAWDGTGYGLDGTIWGGEFLKVNSTGFERFAHLRTFPLPGGEAAVKEPRRSALGLLYELFGEDLFDSNCLSCLAAFTETELKTFRAMLRKRLNVPRTSSMGRLFDAIASLVGIGQASSFEGQTAMQLEWSVPRQPRASEETYPLIIHHRDEGAPLVIDWEPMVRAVLADTQSGVSIAECAEKFHNTLVEMIVQMARRSGQKQIVLSGGCFQNEQLLTRTVNRLNQEVFFPLWHQRVPPNDGGIALGQLASITMNAQPENRIQMH